MVLPVGLAVDGDGARRRPVQSHDHAHGRGLAGAVRAEEPGVTVPGAIVKLREVTVPAGGASEGWSGPGAGSQACCGVRCGSVLRLVAMVAGDAVRRGQVQAERRMKARSSTSSPMERP